ncbi:MAG: hypothetical protein ABI862_20305 [Ilumatobacteraceae bacterium]
MTNPEHTSPKRSDRNRQLLGLTSGLLALQVLNLVVFDDLRVDPLAGVLETFTKPQHLSSIAAVLLAVILLFRKHPAASRVAGVVAWIEISAFTFFHGIPIEIGPSKPYWGDGAGDALQWVGFLSILAISAAIVVTGRRARNSPEQRVARTNAVTVTKSKRDHPMAAAVLAQDVSN